jgi:hypothetical protein
MVHVGLHSVGTYHKKFVWQNKKNKNILCRVSAVGHSAKLCLPSVIRWTLGKAFLPSVRVPDPGHSTKYIF